MIHSLFSFVTVLFINEIGKGVCAFRIAWLNFHTYHVPYIKKRIHIYFELHSFAALIQLVCERIHSRLRRATLIKCYCFSKHVRYADVLHSLYLFTLTAFQHYFKYNLFSFGMFYCFILGVCSLGRDLNKYAPFAFFEVGG